MSKLPAIKGSDVLKILLKNGFCINHQKGSHARLFHITKTRLKVTISIHNKELPEKTLKSILKQADIAEDDFIKLLKA